MTQPNNYVNDLGLKIVFLGTPEFAVPILEKLAQSRFRPATVFCAPDKPVGRKQILTPPPVKIAAQKYEITIFQTASISDFEILISDLMPDLIISAAFGLILTKKILAVPKYGCLNIHPSLLPKYRGASPIQAAILNGDAETGVTIFKMDEGVDTGPILANGKWQMANGKYTTPQSSEKLSHLGADLLLKILPDWISGKITPQPQDESLASRTAKIKKEDGLINWRKSAEEIERMVRAYQPWPGAFSLIAGSESRVEKIKILEAEISGGNQKNIGEIFTGDKNEFCVQTSNGILIIKKLQPENGKPMNASDYLRGRKEILGKIFS